MSARRKKVTADQVVTAIQKGASGPLYLVSGDLVVAQPAAERIAAAVAEASGCVVESFRRPADLAPVLADLKTFSLFGGAKVVLVTESAVLTDRAAAASLIDEAGECVPSSGDVEELSSRELRSARRLLQALQLFGVDAGTGAPDDVLGLLPEWAFKGGAARKRARTKKQVGDLRDGLAVLLAAARRHQVAGWSDSEQAELGAALDGGFPEGHSLVLCERSVATDHPVVAELSERGAFVELVTVTQERSGWTGLDALAAQLAEETGTAIARPALEELARRTLRGSGGRSQTADAETTGRLAAEYRKLAAISGGAKIEKQLVESATEDRGAEDVWSVLDAIGQGNAGLALDRAERIFASADDLIAARLSLFALLAEFCRQLTAVGGLLELRGLPKNERNYNRFKDRIAPALAADLPDGSPSPLAGLHPFRLFRAYQATARVPYAALGTLLHRLLEAELRLKGESSRPHVAFSELICEIAAVVRGRSRIA